MPDISLPEVRLRDKLPEGLRDMSMDDIQKAIPEVRLPTIDLGREARRAGQAAENAAQQAGKAAGKAASKAAKEADKLAREADKLARAAQKSAGREAGKASKAVEKALPRRSGVNPVPIAILAMLGGAVVGWILATNPATGPRISAWLDDMRMRFDAWRGGSDQYDDDWSPTEPQAFPEAGRAPISPEPYGDTLPASETGMSVKPGSLPQGMGTSDPAATDRPH